MKSTRYEQGIIRRVPRASGFAWAVRLSTGKVDGKQTGKTLCFDGAKYPTEASVRKVIQHTILIKDEESSQAKVDANSGAITALNRKDHYPGIDEHCAWMQLVLLTSRWPS